MTTEKVLSPQVELFCSNYTAIGTPTFSHKQKSALAAGFAETSAANSATKLLRDPVVQQRIKELNAENMSRNNITTDKVLQDLENVRLLSIEKGDYSTAKECSVWQGKHLAMFSENLNVGDTERQQERAKISAEEAAALREIISIRIHQITAAEIKEEQEKTANN